MTECSLPPAFPRAFAVWFKDLSRWDASSFHRIKWYWPESVMAPIGSALHIRKERVDKTKFKFSELQPFTIHFDGSVDKRVVDANREYSMDLWFARPGDIVVAKIDLKNGAIGIVPKGWSNVVVTGHFAVYTPQPDKLLPEYLHRIIQAPFFKAHLWRNKVGAEGRKEVKLEFFESERIPLPSITEQQAIVAEWQKAQDEIRAACERVTKLEKRIEKRFFDDLGVTPREQMARPKCFAVWWREFVRFSMSSTAEAVLGLDSLKSSTYPEVQLGSVAQVSYGIQKCPANRPGLHSRPYLRVANVRKGHLDLTEVKEINVPDSELETYLLRPGDILFVEGNGSRSELGRVAEWNGEIEGCVHQNHLIKVRVDQMRLLPRFAMTWFNTELGRGHFFRAAKSSSGLGTINSSEVRSAPLPLPPLTIQKQIMERVAAGRAEIARERLAADMLAQTINGDIEALILGTKTLTEE